MRVGWISIGNEDFGSTRIAVTNNHKMFPELGVESFILHYNKDFNGSILGDIENIKSNIISKSIDIVVFHKVFLENAQNLAKWCASNNVKVIYTAGDWTENPMYSLADVVIVGSSYMANALKKKYNLSKIFHVEDGIETESQPIKKSRNTRDVILGWFGNFQKLDYTKSFIESLNIQNANLFTISNAPCRYTSSKADITMGAATPNPWSTEILIDKLLNFVDICVIPIEPPKNEKERLSNFAKTANRLTFAMSLGVPCVVSRIPAYEAIIENKVNGFICDTKYDWINYLEFLRNTDQRDIIGRRSYREIRKKYSQKNISKIWIKLLSK